MIADRNLVVSEVAIHGLRTALSGGSEAGWPLPGTDGKPVPGARTTARSD